MAADFPDSVILVRRVDFSGPANLLWRLVDFPDSALRDAMELSVGLDHGEGVVVLLPNLLQD
jgi:hypothetical protein